MPKLAKDQTATPETVQNRAVDPAGSDKPTTTKPRKKRPQPKTRRATPPVGLDCSVPEDVIFAPPKKTKQANLVELLERESGATISEIMAATNWQAHSVRGAISGTVKKKLGLSVTSEMEPDRGRVYRIQKAEQGR